MKINLNGLYEEYGRYIYHLCLKLTRNKDEAEDLMQDVWLKVVRYSGRMDSCGSYESMVDDNLHEHIP